jgi:hypothetical protein
MLYRADRSLRYGPRHWSVTTNRARLWGPEPLADVENLTSLLRVEHRWASRTDTRLDQAVAYYQRRDEAGVEGRQEATARRAGLAQNAARYLNEDA